MKLNRKARREDGAAMVEMALVTPLLLLLVFGIIEFGWLFGQFNEIRHAVRETARYAAVSNPDKDGDGNVTSDDVVLTACNALNLPTGSIVNVEVTASGARDVGDNATVTITASVPSLSNAPIVTLFLPDELANSAEFRLEQEALWADLNEADAC
jgi:Flp pilus assembly protein TadG